MPPFRNPFGRKPPQVNGNGVTSAQEPEHQPTAPNASQNGSLRSDTGSSRASSALSIKPSREPNEYKLSVVNDSGVYLPPSPPEKKGFWQRAPNSTTSSSHRSMLSENEPFSISRESFESYRRSFDISARSPVPQPDVMSPRQSLDSRTGRSPRSAINGNRKFERPQPTDEEGFEDVGLNDETKPKKRGIFSRFGDTSEPASNDENSRPSSSHRGFHIPGHIPGRKRGQSGQGAELNSMDRKKVDPGEDVVIR